MTGTTLVMGAAAAATGLIGRRVRVWYEESVAQAIQSKRPVRYEGTVLAVGSTAKGLQIWVEQECEDAYWMPKGSIFSATTSDGDGILLLPPEEPKPEPVVDQAWVHEQAVRLTRWRDHDPEIVLSPAAVIRAILREAGVKVP